MRTKRQMRRRSRITKKKNKSGAGWFSKDAKFIKAIKKAQSSETKFINQYNKYANETDKYFKVLSKHLDNLQALDFWLPETLSKEGAFVRMFRN